MTERKRTFPLVLQKLEAVFAEIKAIRLRDVYHTPSGCQHVVRECVDDALTGIQESIRALSQIDDIERDLAKHMQECYARREADLEQD